MSEPNKIDEVPEWLQTMHCFDDNEIPYHAARLECADCKQKFLISLSDKNKDWTPDCIGCQSKNTKKTICQTFHSRVSS